MLKTVAFGTNYQIDSNNYSWYEWTSIKQFTVLRDNCVHLYAFTKKWTVKNSLLNS
jgi:hypothetical protein